jgi:hypothetical protein
LLFAEFDINIGNQNDVSLDSGIDVADLGGIGSKKINISPCHEDKCTDGKGCWCCFRKTGFFGSREKCYDDEKTCLQKCHF